jgi:hypothetical protein
VSDEKPGPIVFETQAEKKAREHSEEQRQDRRDRKLQLWFNGALMVSAIVTTGVVLYQNRILRQTLDEMAKQTPAVITSADAARDAVLQARDYSDRSLSEAQRSNEVATRAARAAEAGVLAARNGLALTAAQFARDQQPYVLPTNVRPERSFTVGDIAQWRIEYRNFGRSPALRVRAAGRVFTGRDTKKLAIEYLNGLETPMGQGPGYFSVSILPPEQTAAEFSTAQSRAPLTAEQHASLKMGDFPMIIVGRFEYDDILGNAYQSDFCRGTLATGAIATCPDFNTIRTLPNPIGKQQR